MPLDIVPLQLPLVEVALTTSTSFAGHVEEILDRNDETGLSLFRLRTEHEAVVVRARLPFLYLGLFATVQFSDDSSFNDDVRIAKSVSFTQPRAAKHARRFLKSAVWNGLPPSLSKRLAKNLGSDLFSVLDFDPKRLLKIEGIGQQRRQQILTLWKRYRAIVNFRTFLLTKDLPLKWADLLETIEPGSAENHFKLRPYDFVISARLPFAVVDGFALTSGFTIGDRSRVRAAIFGALFAHCDQGHCAYPCETLLDELQLALTIPREKIEETLELEFANEDLVFDTINGEPCTYLPFAWNLEREVATNLKRMALRQSPLGWINIPKSLEWAQRLLKIKLAPLQQTAIEAALQSSISVITGGPGTGKTTLIRTLVTILNSQFTRFALCSPTGRAAQRLEEVTGAPAQTIHRLLQCDRTTGRFKYNSGRRLPLDVLLIDEMSMVDLELMAHLLAALPETCALIMVGDADQIPSIGAGTVLRSIISSGHFTTVHLTEIFRQQEKSLIKTNARRILDGHMPMSELPGVSPTVAEAQKDFHLKLVKNSDEALSVILRLVTTILPQHFGIHALTDFQVLSPVHKGPLGTQRLNDVLQKHLGHQRHVDEPYAYKPGDKVMMIRNDYHRGFFNGDIGFVTAIHAQRGALSIALQSRDLFVTFDEAREWLTLAHAISIHKSQGSEYRAVILVIGDDHAPRLNRQLLYTAITRGKEQVFVIAQPNALQKALLINESDRRWQGLTELLSATT